MPARRQSGAPQLAPGQASYVLERLIEDRRISPGEVNRYLSDMHREISELEQRLASLRAASTAGGRGRGRAGRPRAAATSGAAPAPARRRRRARLSPEQAASRKLQGRYLGLIRQIPASRRGQYQKIAREKGREAAIKEMAAALGK